MDFIKYKTPRKYQPSSDSDLEILDYGKIKLESNEQISFITIDKKEYENKLVFLMGVDKARFRNPVIPDCKLELNIEAIRSHGRVWKYKGEAFVEGKKMADAQWSATIVDRK